MVARWVGLSVGFSSGAALVDDAVLMAEIASSLSATVALSAFISRASRFSFQVFFLGPFPLPPFELGFFPKSLFTFRAAALIAASSSFSSGDKSVYSSLV